MKPNSDRSLKGDNDKTTYDSQTHGADRYFAS